MSRARRQRHATPIHMYVGANGGGKSLAMIYDTALSLDLGRPVLSTVQLLDPDCDCDRDTVEAAWRETRPWMDADERIPSKCPHPLYTPLRYWSQLLTFRFGDVLLDEAQGVASSRSHSVTPTLIVNLFLQLRRCDVILRATAPSFARVDVAIREVVQAVTLCQGFLGKRIEGRLWPATRLFLWRTYDAVAFDEFTFGTTEDRKKKLTTLARQLYWRPGGLAESYYDTYAAVDHIADLSESGTCLACGGSRRRPRCSCEPDSGERSRGPAQRGATASHNGHHASKTADASVQTVSASS